MPLGDLPQTGAVAAPVDPAVTAGLIALAMSMTAAGLAICIARKNRRHEV